MIRKPVNYITFTAVACIMACMGEFLSLFIFGSLYPGYSQLKETMSSLGASVSPVSNEISAWWVIMGFLIIFFGTGFMKSFSEKKKYGTIASWLIILYGFGEGIGSGVFKADHLLNSLTNSGIWHDILGGIGVTAILVLPLIMFKVITKKENLFFHRLSWIVFWGGIITVVLFAFRFSTNENNFLSLYKGLWQRLFMLNTYIYLSTISIIMIRKQQEKA